MRNVQKILYRIGAIINWVLLGIYGLVFLINLGVLIYDAFNDYAISDNIAQMVTMLILAALILVLLILVGKLQEEALTCKPNNLKAVILLMVFGFLSGNELYLVGGVFGIIAGSQEANAEQPKEEEKAE